MDQNKKAGAEPGNGRPQRHPSAGEQRWEEQTLKPALKISGAAEGIHHPFRRADQPPLHAR